MKTTVQKLIKNVPLKMLIAGTLFVIALLFFSFITREVFFEHEDDLDLKVTSFVNAHSSPALISVITWFTFFGSSQFLLPAYIVLVGFYCIAKNYRRAIDIAIIALSSTFLMLILKQVFHRQRPDLPILKGLTTYSFPSGHALSSFIFCSILGYLVVKGTMLPVWKWIFVILLLLLCVTIGVSRIILNVHYTTDVIAGFSLGIMWVILVFYVLRSMQNRRSSKTAADIVSASDRVDP